jgi:hypothetical protein
MNLKKVFSIALIVIVLLNMIFYAVGWVGAIPFWIIIIVAAVTAYLVIPRMKTK